MKRFGNQTLIFISIVFLTFFTYSANSQLKDDSKSEIQKLATAMQIIGLTYVDSVSLNELVENSIIETLDKLDPHSSYLSKDEVKKANEPLEGSFEGIGVSFQVYNDTILVIAPIPGGPSESLGIMAGDKIVKIDGESATGDHINNQWVMDHLRGKKGSKVDVTVFRKASGKFIDYTIVRDKIPVNSIDATYMATKDIGYIKLNRFSKTSLEEFQESVKILKREGMKSLILDLRGNSGGYLGTAIDLSDEFLGFDELIVYTEGLNSPRQDFKATLLGSFKDGRLTILINEGSASASEIVAGAVQDLDRGIIIGRRSFGKGLVQRPFELPDGSMIRLTTARYYTPSGRYIQRPYDEGTEAYYMDFIERYNHGEMMHQDSIKFPDSLKYETSNGRTVYGGGGIMPDVFVPWDSTWYSEYYADLRKEGLINQYSLDVVDANRESLLSTYPDLNTFIDKFSVEGKIMDDFFELAEAEGIEFDEKGWESSGLTIETQIKALIARNLWDIGAYFQIMTQIDNEYQKAIEVINDDAVFLNLN